MEARRGRSTTTRESTSLQKFEFSSTEQVNNKRYKYIYSYNRYVSESIETIIIYDILSSQLAHFSVPHSLRHSQSSVLEAEDKSADDHFPQIFSQEIQISSIYFSLPFIPPSRLESFPFVLLSCVRLFVSSHRRLILSLSLFVLSDSLTIVHRISLR
jgi:hypothetical protein